MLQFSCMTPEPEVSSVIVFHINVMDQFSIKQPAVCSTTLQHTHKFSGQAVYWDAHKVR
jgi:hypothetical protein